MTGVVKCLGLSPRGFPLDYSKLPTFFSEVAGMPGEGLDPVWETSETAQVTYVSRLAAVLKGKDTRMVNWLFLYPMENPGDSPTAWKVLGSVSLRDKSGKKRAVYDPWLSFFP